LLDVILLILYIFLILYGNTFLSDESHHGENTIMNLWGSNEYMCQKLYFIVYVKNHLVNLMLY